MTQVRSQCIDETFPDISKLQAKLIGFSVFSAFYTLAINMIVGIYKNDKIYMSICNGERLNAFPKYQEQEKVFALNLSIQHFNEGPA